MNGSDCNDAAVPGQARTKLLTFESWFTNAAWCDYALAHRDLVPFPLVDRSPCQDPFFDPFADRAHRRPVISGLCRGRAMKNFSIGDRFIYITRIDRHLAGRYGQVSAAGPSYFAVAALRVVGVWQSHRAAASDFAARRYVARPGETPYPPNLAFADRPDAAVARDCSVVYENDRAHLPDDATGQMWARQYCFYRDRQVQDRLRAAECRVETVGGRECLQLLPGSAPVMTSECWGGLRMNVTGRWIPEELAQRIRSVIAHTE